MRYRDAGGEADNHIVVVIVGGYLGVETQIVDCRSAYIRSRLLPIKKPSSGARPQATSTLTPPLMIASSL
jgi:hypothetical protein